MDNIKQYFEKQFIEQQKTKFNIFSVLHKETEEVRLHSRFIAYLLSPNSKHLLSPKSHHGMGNDFLKLFVTSVLNITDFDCENCIVKTEDKDIDIFISNGKQEIIIENKIYAGDQPFQLVKYYNKRISENNKGEKGITQVVYLTLGRHSPSESSRGNIPNEKIKFIDYTQDIKRWLTDCITITEKKDDFFAKTIYQYKELITKLTSDVKQAQANQTEISKNIESAWELQSKEKFFTEKCKDIFKHVKWHTVAYFINKLEEELKIIEAKNIIKPDAKTITRITHNNSKKEKLIIRFSFNNTELQIVNDSKGFTLGNLTTSKWDYFSDEIKDIRFCDFSNENTFKIINQEERTKIIKKIIEEVMRRYNNLEKTF